MRLCHLMSKEHKTQYKFNIKNKFILKCILDTFRMWYRTSIWGCEDD